MSPITTPCGFGGRIARLATGFLFALSAANGQVVLAQGTDWLQAGDANQDLRFDQFDIVQVLQVGKYLTGEAATWGEGDWDGAPGGYAGNPPQGNGLFDQLDIIAALPVRGFLQGPYAALTADAVDRDRTRLIPANSQLIRAEVPEPPALVLLAAGLLILVLRRQNELLAEGHLLH